MAKLNDKNGNWYTDKQGNHYFVADGETPKEGWEKSKRMKMIKGGKPNISEDGSNFREVDYDEYSKFEGNDDDFDLNEDSDFDIETTAPETKKKYYISTLDGAHEMDIEATSQEEAERIAQEKLGSYAGGDEVQVEEIKEDSDKDKPTGDNLNPNNPKYKGFDRSHITNAKEVDEGYTYTNSEGKEVKESIIEYIPYGALQDGNNKKLYGIVTNYDGSDAPDIGAQVTTDLESAKKELEESVKYGIQGSDRYGQRGQYDEDFFNMLNDKQYGWDQETKDKYSKKYGWDFNKPFKEHDFMKDDPYEKWKSEREKKIDKLSGDEGKWQPRNNVGTKTINDNTVKKYLNNIKSEDSDITEDEINTLTTKLVDYLDKEQKMSGEDYKDIKDAGIEELFDSSSDEIADLGKKLLGTRNDNEDEEYNKDDFDFYSRLYDYLNSKNELTKETIEKDVERYGLKPEIAKKLKQKYKFI